MCQFPHYFSDDPDARDIAELYKNIKTPISAANSLDDRWATPKSRDAFMLGYINAHVETKDIDPEQFTGGPGHMGYFKTSAFPLWRDALEWFLT